MFNFVQECSNFTAGSVVLTPAQTRKLDITGVFGAVCKHGIPLKFINMHHGERYVQTPHLSTVDIIYGWPPFMQHCQENIEIIFLHISFTCT